MPASQLYRLRAVEVARKYLRLGVHETPWGSNWGGYVATFLHRVGLGPNPWCDAFVYSCFSEAGYLLPRTGLVSTTWNWGLGRGYAFRRGVHLPEAGDIICFEWDRYLGRGDILDHVGIVSGRSGSRVYTIEGNAGDRVASRSYDLNDGVIYGYIRVPGGPVNPQSSGAPYVTKPFPLPTLVKLAGGRAKIMLGRRVLYSGGYRRAKALYADKLAYWTNRNKNRR